MHRFNIVENNTTEIYKCAKMFMPNKIYVILTNIFKKNREGTKACYCSLSNSDFSTKTKHKSKYLLYIVTNHKRLQVQLHG